MEATDAKGKARRYLPYAMILAAYVFIGALASHPFDDAIYAQNAQLFYLFKVPPIFVLPMGLYFDFIDIGGYFFTIILSLFHIQNVITIQLGVKIPFIMLSFLTSFVVYKIGRELGFNGRYASLVLLTSPMYVFIALIYGSAIIVSVFFLIASLLFMVRRRTTLSAIFYGMSMGSYIYPIFAIPFLLRYYWVREGRKKSILFLVVSSAFAAIGQLSIILLFYLKGLGTQAPLSIAGYLAPLTFLPPYSPLDILNIFGLGGILPGETIKIIYYGSTILASFIYFALPREKVNVTSLIIFLFIQGIIFSSLFPNNIPSYMAAEIPLAIIVAFMLRKWIFIGLMWMSSFLGFLVMQTIVPTGFLVYFTDLNHNLMNASYYRPSLLFNIAGSAYAISILFDIFFLKQKKGRMTPTPKKTLIAQYTIVAAIVVVALVVLLPVATQIPPDMYLSQTIDSFTSSASSEYIAGTSLIATYNFPVLGSMDQGGIDHFLGQIVLPDSYYVIYKLSPGYTVESGSFIQSISLPYPLQNGTFQLTGTVLGTVSLTLENLTSSFTPQESQSHSGNSALFSFNAGQHLSGKYTMFVNSSAPLWLHNSTSLAVSIIGVPSYGFTSINNRVISNDIVEPSQLGGTVIVKYSGPFYEIPDEIPLLTVFMIEPLKNQSTVSLQSVLLLLPGLLFCRLPGSPS